MKNRIVLTIPCVAAILLLSCEELESRKMVDDTKVAGKQVAQIPESTPARLSIYKLNEAIQLGDYFVTVTRFNDNVPPPDDITLPKEGNKFVSIEVLYENRVGSRQLEYYPFDWQLVDGEGYHYEADFNVAKQPVLQSGTLKTGQKSRGWITFQTVKSAGNFKLQFEPSGLYNSSAEIRLK
jgi:hypothetical protein